MDNDGFIVDHITPVCLGGDTVPQNLQLICPTCSFEKSSKETQHVVKHGRARPKPTEIVSPYRYRDGSLGYYSTENAARTIGIVAQYFHELAERSPRIEPTRIEQTSTSVWTQAQIDQVKARRKKRWPVKQ